MKSYKGPACSGFGTEAEWDAATVTRYGSDIVFIREKDDESASFVCPVCWRESDGSEIVEWNAEAVGGKAQPLTVKFRRLSPHARIPTRATAGAAGFDLYAVEDTIIGPGETKTVPLGFSVEIPPGYEMQIRPRSGISLKTKLRVANSPGTVDSDFTGEVVVILDNIAPESEFDDAYPWKIDGWVDAVYEGEGCAYHTYNIYTGDRIAQAVIAPVPDVAFVEVDGELPETERGTGGFGSTGTTGE